MTLMKASREILELNGIYYLGKDDIIIEEVTELRKVDRNRGRRA